MSATTKVGPTSSDGQAGIDPKLPLMAPFYSLFLLSSSKVKRCEELERALTLFIEVLDKYEINADLRKSTVADAKRLRSEVNKAKLSFHRGAELSSNEVTALHMDYQDVVRVYGEKTVSQFEEFQKEFRSLWKGKASSANSTTEVQTSPPTSDNSNKTIRSIVNKALTATLSKARSAIKSEKSGQTSGNALSDHSSELSNEGPRATSVDIQKDFYVFEKKLAKEMQSDNLADGQPSGALQTGAPITVEDDIPAPRASEEWPRRHRVQISEGGQFRLIRGRSEMAARRDSYDEEEDASPGPSARRPGSSAASVDDAASSTSNLGVHYYYQHHARHSLGNASEITGTPNLSLYSYEE